MNHFFASRPRGQPFPWHHAVLLAVVVLSAGGVRAETAGDGILGVSATGGVVAAINLWASKVLVKLVLGTVISVLVAFLIILNRRLHRTQDDLRRQQDQLERLVARRTAELQSIFDAADNVAFVTTDLNGTATKVVGFSPGAEKIFGYTAAEIIGQDIAVLYLAEDVRGIPEIQQNLREGNPGFSGEATLVRKSGEPFAVLLKVHPLHDENKTLIGSLGVCIDISSHRQAETALAASQNKFEAITNQAIEGITIADIDGHYTFVNRAFCEMMGYSREELLQMTVFDVKAKNQDHTSFEKSKSTQEGIPFQVVLERKDGTEFISEVLGKVVDINGVDCVLGIVRDITTRTESEAALRASEDRLVEAQKAARLGHYVLNTKTGMWHNSQELDDIFGIDDDFNRDVEGWLEIVHPDFRTIMAAYIQEHVFTNHQPFDRQYKIVDQKTGREKWVHGLGELKLDADNQPVEMFGVIQDITEKIKLEDQLRQAQKMESVGRLAGGVAHDFNNMLGVILGHAELALEELTPSQPLYADLSAIKSTAERSAELTRQLLAFARKQTISPRVLDLNETVAGMLKMLRRLIGEDIDLTWLPGNEVWPVMVDPSQIDQVLVNLCVNSRDAIESIGKITIETSNTSFDVEYCDDHPAFKPGEYVLLAVSDNGVGMDKETLDKVYEPFFTTKELGRGTGLGLATVYGIVKQNDCFINVYSELGTGTSFKIYLPRQTAAPMAAAAVDPVTPVAKGDETILLVEDEPAILDLTQRILERLGYAVVSASTPTEAVALAEARATEIVLLLTDVVMPEMSGLDLAAQLRSSYPGLRCLFMSGYTANVIAQHGVLEDGVHFIQKPFKKNDLAISVRTALDQA